jgi:hypothetical protein
MTRHQLQEAIESPLERVGVSIHSTVVQELLNQCADQADPRRALQDLLRYMFESRPRRFLDTLTSTRLVKE